MRVTHARKAIFFSRLIARIQILSQDTKAVKTVWETVLIGK